MLEVVKKIIKFKRILEEMCNRKEKSKYIVYLSICYLKDCVQDWENKAPFLNYYINLENI